MFPVFDSPQWKVRRMDTVDTFAGLSNEVEVYTTSSEDPRLVPIVPPTELFKYAKDVLKVEDMSEVMLYLDQIEGGGWVFGVSTRRGHYDLWAYKTLPGWAGKD